MAQLAVSGLRKRYGRALAVDGLSFAVASGESVALIGPNGAGKSTTFLCLAGLVRPDEGDVLYDGRVLRGARGRTIALIPETPDVYPLLTVAEHLAFTARLCGLERGWEQRADALLERFGLAERRDDLGHTLSKGLLQKTLIAATVLAATPVLLLDEPMIGLDPRGQRELRDVLRSLRDGGTAIVVSTHQLDAAAMMCDRAVVLDRGRVAAAGTFDEVRALGDGSLEDVFLRITSV